MVEIDGNNGDVDLGTYLDTRATRHAFNAEFTFPPILGGLWLVQFDSLILWELDLAACER